MRILKTEVKTMNDDELSDSSVGSDPSAGSGPAK